MRHVKSVVLRTGHIHLAAAGLGTNIGNNAGLEPFAQKQFRFNTYGSRGWVDLAECVLFSSPFSDAQGVGRKPGDFHTR
jgi:hypothetical protein